MPHSRASRALTVLRLLLKRSGHGVVCVIAWGVFSRAAMGQVKKSVTLPSVLSLVLPLQGVGLRGSASAIAGWQQSIRWRRGRPESGLCRWRFPVITTLTCCRRYSASTPDTQSHNDGDPGELIVSQLAAVLRPRELTGRNGEEACPIPAKPQTSTSAVNPLNPNGIKP